MTLAWQIEISDRARKQLATLDGKVATRIADFLEFRVAQAEDPRRLGEALKGSRFQELWRYRVGDYRVIVRIEDAVLRLLVVQIGHRREGYR